MPSGATATLAATGTPCASSSRKEDGVTVVGFTGSEKTTVTFVPTGTNSELFSGTTEITWGGKPTGPEATFATNSIDRGMSNKASSAVLLDSVRWVTRKSFGDWLAAPAVSSRATK